MQTYVVLAPTTWWLAPRGVSRYKRVIVERYAQIRAARCAHVAFVIIARELFVRRCVPRRYNISHVTIVNLHGCGCARPRGTPGRCMHLCISLSCIRRYGDSRNSTECARDRTPCAQTTNQGDIAPPAAQKSPGRCVSREEPRVSPKFVRSLCEYDLSAKAT